METLQERMNFLIEKLGYKKGKKGEFAQVIGFSPTYITKILNGYEVNPSKRFFESVSREFDVNPIWLKTGTGEIFYNQGNGLTEKQHLFFKNYFSLSEKRRKIIDETIENFLLAEKFENEHMPSNNEEIGKDDVWYTVYGIENNLNRDKVENKE